MLDVLQDAIHAVEELDGTDAALERCADQGHLYDGLPLGEALSLSRRRSLGAGGVHAADPSQTLAGAAHHDSLAARRSAR